MNKERILELAAHIEKLPHAYAKKGSYLVDDENAPEGDAFYIGRWVYITYDEQENRCRTPACLAGWTVFLFDNEQFSQIDFDEEWVTSTSELLGLDHATADELCVPPYELIDKITPKVAASVLRNLAETGEVVWDFRTENENE